MKKKVLLLMLVLMFMSTNALSQNWISGQITGDLQEGISVELYKTVCGGEELVETVTTNSEGYYGFGCLDDGTYRIEPKNLLHYFSPVNISIDIPQTQLQPRDFLSFPNTPFIRRPTVLSQTDFRQNP